MHGEVAKNGFTLARLFGAGNGAEGQRVFAGLAHELLGFGEALGRVTLFSNLGGKAASSDCKPTGEGLCLRGLAKKVGECRPCLNIAQERLGPYLGQLAWIKLGTNAVSAAGLPWSAMRALTACTSEWNGSSRCGRCRSGPMRPITRAKTPLGCPLGSGTGLQCRRRAKESQGSTPTRHEQEAKWEIPVYQGGDGGELVVRFADCRGLRPRQIVERTFSTPVLSRSRPFVRDSVRKCGHCL